MSEEEKEELQELIKLLYNGHISQYGKRKLEEYINKLQADENKLINYIAIREDKTYEEVEKEFEIGE